MSLGTAEGPYVVLPQLRWTVYVNKNNAWAAYPGGEDLAENAARALAERLRARGVDVRVES